MATGRGRFRKEVDGHLEISASDGAHDDRLRGWIHESGVVLPVLQALVKKHGRGLELRGLLLGLKDLGRRIDAVERELARLRRSPA
jgi:hypothetical protein